MKAFFLGGGVGRNGGGRKIACVFGPFCRRLGDGSLGDSLAAAAVFLLQLSTLCLYTIELIALTHHSYTESKHLDWRSKQHDSRLWGMDKEVHSTMKMPNGKSACWRLYLLQHLDDLYIYTAHNFFFIIVCPYPLAASLQPQRRTLLVCCSR